MYIRRRARPKPWMAKKKGRTKPAFAGGTNASTNPLYRTARWRATRESVLFNQPICYWCEAMGLVVEATDADHIVPSSSLLSEAEFFNQDNIVGSCRRCNLSRASYSAKGVYFESKEEWAAYLKRRRLTP